MTKQIRVAVAGAAGRMGQEAVTTLQNDERFEVAALVVRDAGQAAKNLPSELPIYDDIHAALSEQAPDVWLDLTRADVVVENIETVLTYNVRPVVGASGYGPSDLARWDKVLREKNLGGIACPNFALGALLMISFAQEAAKFMEHAEIIELHHDGKKDAPSGTAKRTQEAMGLDEVPIHSIRLPGLVAHQEVIFGGTGETLTIRHDSLSRSSFMPGVLVACAGVGRLSGMVNGLENLLW